MFNYPCSPVLALKVTSSNPVDLNTIYVLAMLALYLWPRLLPCTPDQFILTTHRHLFIGNWKLTFPKLSLYSISIPHFQTCHSSSISFSAMVSGVMRCKYVYIHTCVLERWPELENGMIFLLFLAIDWSKLPLLNHGIPRTYPGPGHILSCIPSIKCLEGVERILLNKGKKEGMFSVNVIYFYCR